MHATEGILITQKLVKKTTFLPPDNKIWKKKIITRSEQIRSEKKRKKIVDDSSYSGVMTTVKICRFRRSRAPQAISCSTI